MEAFSFRASLVIVRTLAFTLLWGSLEGCFQQNSDMTDLTYFEQGHSVKRVRNAWAEAGSPLSGAITVI